MATGRAIDPARDVVLVEVDGRLVGVTSVQRQVRDDTPIYDLWGRGRRRRSAARHRTRAARLDASGSGARACPVEDPGRRRGDRRRRRRAGDRPSRPARAGGLRAGPPLLPDAPHRRSTTSRDVPLPDGLEIRPVSPEQRSRGSSRPSSRRSRTTGATARWARTASARPSAARARTRTCGSSPGTATRSPASSRTGSGPRRTSELGVKRGWLERISVRRPWRRRGLARAITAGCAPPAARGRHGRGHARASIPRTPTGRSGCTRDSASRCTAGRPPTGGRSTGAGAAPSRRQANSRPPSRTSSIQARSRPIVVAGPCPGKTAIRSSSPASRAIDSTIASASPPGRSTRPQPAANSVSPLYSRPSSSARRQTDPSVCPGRVEDAQPDRPEPDRAALGQLDGRHRRRDLEGRERAARDAPTGRDRAGGRRSRRPVWAATAALSPMWSQCPWVETISLSVQSRAASSSAIQARRRGRGVDRDRLARCACRPGRGRWSRSGRRPG